MASDLLDGSMSGAVPHPNGRPRLQFSFRALLGCVTVLAVVFGITAPRPQRLPETFPVTGTITMDGAPVSGAIVTFIPLDRGGQVASGFTDNNGDFTLGTRFSKASSRGALAGDYDVLVTKIDWQRINQRDDVWFEGVPAPEGTHLLPEKYSSSESGITATIQEGVTNRFLFDLKAVP